MLLLPDSTMVYQQIKQFLESQSLAINIGALLMLSSVMRGVAWLIGNAEA